jgi:hypothetical protein
MSTPTPLFDRRPSPRRQRQQSGLGVDEKREQTQVAIFIGLFSAIALVMCAMAVIVSGDSLDGKLWLIWLIFVGGLSKLLLANGVFWGMLHHDAQTKLEQATRTRSHATRSLSPATGKLPPPPRIPPSRPIRRHGPLTVAANNRERTRDPRPQ